MKLLNAANRILAPLDIQITPSWKVQWWSRLQQFQFGGRVYTGFVHPYNCGWPPYATERSVELALADEWLGAADRDPLVELGAVTPYYWPRRVSRIVDPFDPHPNVTDRTSLFDVDLTHTSVLSISTLEHIGTGDYEGVSSSESAAEAFRKIFREAAEFFITVPSGYNDAVDDLLFRRHEVPADVKVGALVRNADGAWVEERVVSKAWRPYGDPALQRRFAGTCIGRWANSVAVLQRDVRP